MAGKRKTPLWRQTFLRALARTGNVRASAFEAGVDKVTAYNHRRKDAAFAGKWDAALRRCSGQALGKGNPPSRKAMADKGSAKTGGEMVLRRTKHGDKLVRAAAGRWSGRVEESFLAGLELTGCVRSAAAAAGISTNALYERRKHYPEFAARWDEVAGRAGQELPTMLQVAARESLSRPPRGGQKRRGRARLPRVDVDQAIRISAIAARKEAGGGRRGIEPRVATNAEVFEALTKRFAAFGKRVRAEQLAEGWSETEDGHMIPPGWVYVGTPGDGEGAGIAEEGDSRGRGDSHE